ncbi:unnamed protein product [Aphanomyces euteiches]
MSMTRRFLADPAFVKKAKEGRTDENNTCIGKMKVTVVGAGPAGSSFATTGIAAERGHEITFFDKQDDIGGLNLAKKALAKNSRRYIVSNCTEQA